MINKIVFFMLFVFFGISTIFPQSVSSVFFVNLYQEPVDVRLGEEDDFVFLANGIETITSTYMVNTTKIGTYSLYFKQSRDNQYFFWAAEDEVTPIDCVVKPGKTHCILIGTNGVPEFFTCDIGSGVGPKAALLNGTDSTLTRIEIAKAWGKQVGLFATDLSKDTITHFVNLPQGEYGLFWQFPWQKEDGDKYYFYPDDSGNNIETFLFRNDQFYLFIACYIEGDTDYGILFNITPKK